MRDYQKELDALRERIARRREHIAVLEKLYEQETFWKETVEQRRLDWDREQRDVDRLERVSLSSLWSSLRGSKEEDMDREKAEEYAARMKLQEAERQLEEIRGEILNRLEQIQADEGFEAMYEQVIKEKEAEYRAKNPILAEKLSDLEQQEMGLVSRRKELREAVTAGSRALEQINAALWKLSDAEGWSSWDMFGGGLLTDMMKYSSMDEAQKLMESVQSNLRRYQAELADVAQTAIFDLQPGSMLQMADIFFDNFFTDWAVRDRIQQSGYQLEGVKDQVNRIQYGLERELDETERGLEAIQKEREELVRRA